MPCTAGSRTLPTAPIWGVAFFLVTTLMMLIIAVVTIIFQAIKVALANTINALHDN